VNYLISEVEFEEIKMDGFTYSPNELGVSKEDSKAEANGPNFKVSVIFPFK